jgi:DNA repair exonuclease SbcCD nuclease subunit
MTDCNYQGVLCIGDPHLEGRQPGFRKDDYPSVILEKLVWCLSYAKRHQLLPLILGDLFDKPRDNATWMIGRLLDLLHESEVLGLYGNHDCADPALNEHDTLSLLVKAGRLRLVDEKTPWRGVMNGRPVIVGGSSYRHPIPETFDPGPHIGGERPVVIWLAHHDILVPGYEEQGRVKPREINRIDYVINGHIHRRLPDVQVGTTMWLTPGNISRRSRSDASRDHIPAALRIRVTSLDAERSYIEVPHRPYSEVFHEVVLDNPPVTEASAFVAGLAELQARRTETGAGLAEFLQANLSQFDAAVAEEILTLAKEVTSDV